MDANAPGDLSRWFGNWEDPRPDHPVMHPLADVLAIAILAVLCGADSWVDVATFGRVFSRIDPMPFEKCFGNWMAAVARSDVRLIAVDGKALRRSFDHASEKAVIHMISAFSQANQLVLGQLATEAKSKEIMAIPQLLKLLDLKAAVVTIDAMGCQKAIAAPIVDPGSDYLLQVKDNAPSLHEDLQLLFAEEMRKDRLGVAYEFTEDTDAGHGRIETRQPWTTHKVDWCAEGDQWKRTGAFPLRRSDPGGRRGTVDGATRPESRDVSSLLIQEDPIDFSALTYIIL